MFLCILLTIETVLFRLLAGVKIVLVQYVCMYVYITHFIFVSS